MKTKQRTRLVSVLFALFALTVGIATATAGNGSAPLKKLCFQGGWQTVYGTDGTIFTGQRDCVSYVTDGGTLTTTPPPVRFGSLIDCELLGGIYLTTDPVWRCNGMYFPDQAHATAATDTLKADCWAEGGTGGFDSLGTIPGMTDSWCRAL
jgi:hypothetical protein